MKYKEPRWVKSIPKGSHGTKSNPITFRYWKLVSDYVRIRDWYKYNKKCVSAKAHRPNHSHYINHWSDGHAGHWRKYSISHAFAKYDTNNIHLSCFNCNQRDDGEVGHEFSAELHRRYGKDIIKTIKDYDNEQRGKKMESWEIEKKMLSLMELMKELPEYPDYIDTAYRYMQQK